MRVGDFHWHFAIAAGVIDLFDRLQFLSACGVRFRAIYGYMAKSCTSIGQNAVLKDTQTANHATGINLNYADQNRIEPNQQHCSTQFRIALNPCSSAVLDDLEQEKCTAPAQIPKSPSKSTNRTSPTSSRTPSYAEFALRRQHRLEPGSPESAAAAARGGNPRALYIKETKIKEQ